LTKSLQGVSEQTRKVLDIIKGYEELSPYTLVGGTAVAIRLNHRLSEDLDLFVYQKFPGRKFNLPNLDALHSRLKNDFGSLKIEHYERTDVTLFLDDVKVQLRAEHQFHGPKDVDRIGKIGLPRNEDLIGMKLVALTLRDAWRDFYDLTCLAKVHGTDRFEQSYNNIMSTKYCGTKPRKAILYNRALQKLKDESLIKRLAAKDPMKGLLLNTKIGPKTVIATFASLKYVQDKNQGLSI